MVLPQVILFPQAVLPLYIFEARYRRMLADVLRGERMFCVAMQRPHCQRTAPFTVAGLGLVRVSVTNDDGTSQLILQGLARVRLGKALQYRPYRVHRLEAISSTHTDTVAADALTAKVFELAVDRLDQGVSLSLPAAPMPGNPALDFEAMTEALRETFDHLHRHKDPERLADLVSCTLLSLPGERQTILETADFERRLRHLIHFLMREIELHRGPPAEPPFLS